MPSTGIYGGAEVPPRTAALLLLYKGEQAVKHCMGARVRGRVQEVIM